ncbi:MAG: hypothetical protein KIT80_06385 [Chitinophagaceae bacterium]|nr:hypothetical protein [Chitinophagaceae bacterium]MCW5926523.1 hypothetical protein [Chitinophagaceae bacterium]
MSQPEKTGVIVFYLKAGKNQSVSELQLFLIGLQAIFAQLNEHDLQTYRCAVSAACFWKRKRPA